MGRGPSTKAMNSTAPNQIKRRADDWIEFVRCGAAKALPAIFRSGHALYLDARDEPEITLQVIIEIVARYSSGELRTDIATEAKAILGMLGAGPLQILLLETGTRFIGEIETIASRDPRFRLTLSYVVKEALPPSTR